jgi:hypothetical protein
MISGIHAIIYSKDAERLRYFFRDVLELPPVDAGRGWLIFALPPAELAAHPSEEDGHHELYLMCDDVHSTVEKLKTKGRAVSSDSRSGLGSGNPAQAPERRRDRPLPAETSDGLET